MNANALNKQFPLDTFPAFEYLPQPENSAAIVANNQAKPAERPIRFPHIPSLNQSPPGASRYVLLNQRELRIDRPHRQLESESNAIRNSEIDRESETAAPIKANFIAVPAKAEEAPQIRSGTSIPTAQIEQIADYLRKKRNELESEQTDLQLSALKQQTEILQEKEQLRGQQLNIQMVQATLEILRRQLIDFGEALSVAAGSNDTLSSRFEAVCQAYFDAAQVAKLLDSGA